MPVVRVSNVSVDSNTAFLVCRQFHPYMYLFTLSMYNAAGYLAGGAQRLFQVNSVLAAFCLAALRLHSTA